MAYPATSPDLPYADVAEVLSNMHDGEGHVGGTNYLIDLGNALAAKLGLGASLPTQYTALLSPSNGNTAYAAITIPYIDSTLNHMLTQSSPMLNGTLTASVASNALTIALKTRGGADPSAALPVSIMFRNVTATSGDDSGLTATAATSLVVPSTATLGAVANTPFRLWVVAFNDGGTLRLGVINCLSGLNIYPLGAAGIASATAIDTASDNAHVFYAGAAVSSKAYTVLGYLEYGSGLATPGTWASAPTKIQLLDAQTKLPGHVVQVQETRVSAAAQGTTAIPIDNTIPQITEGTQFLSQAITPTSAANLLELDVQALLACTSTDWVGGAIFQSGVNNALSSMVATMSAGFSAVMPVHHVMIAAVTSALTFTFRAGQSGAATTYFNRHSGGTDTYGGSAGSFIRAQEIMT